MVIKDTRDNGYRAKRTRECPKCHEVMKTTERPDSDELVED